MRKWYVLGQLTALQSYSSNIVTVLPNIDAYFAATGSQLQAVRPIVCDQTGVAGGVQGNGATLLGQAPGTPQAAFAAAQSLVAGAGNGVVQNGTAIQGQAGAAAGAADATAAGNAAAGGAHATAAGNAAAGGADATAAGNAAAGGADAAGKSITPSTLHLNTSDTYTFFQVPKPPMLLQQSRLPTVRVRVRARAEAGAAPTKLREQ
jgi:hypothetical protein